MTWRAARPARADLPFARRERGARPSALRRRAPAGPGPAPRGAPGGEVGENPRLIGREKCERKRPTKHIRFCHGSYPDKRPTVVGTRRIGAGGSGSGGTSAAQVALPAGQRAEASELLHEEADEFGGVGHAARVGGHAAAHRVVIGEERDADADRGTLRRP